MVNLLALVLGAVLSFTPNPGPVPIVVAQAADLLRNPGVCRERMRPAADDWGEVRINGIPVNASDAVAAIRELAAAQRANGAAIDRGADQLKSALEMPGKVRDATIETSDHVTGSAAGLMVLIFLLKIGLEMARARLAEKKK